MEEPNSGAMQRRITDLEDQAAADSTTIDLLHGQADRDRTTIAGLRTSAAGDKDTITRLEEAAEVDQAVIARLEADGEVDRDRIANLEVALASGRRIGVAMGVLMNERKITEAAAFDLLREASQATHRKLRDVAEDVLLTGALPELR